MTEELVLVTGGSGFIGAHCIVQLLQAGYRVRTTVRSLKRKADVLAMVERGGYQPGDRLSFTQADLTADAGWPEAVAGCKYVLHVASPFPASSPTDENELIIPAREGSLRVLKAARDAGVHRVVLTSSFVAIGYGHPPQPTPFDETNWSDLTGSGITAYAKSKTLAEHAAWDFISSEGNGLELAVINPVGVFGPVLGSDYATSVMIIQKFLEGAVPACPNISFGVVDVRDVADLHIRAMMNREAKGERFLAVSGDNIGALGAAKVIKKRMGAAGKKVPTTAMPDWLVRLLANFVPDLKLVLPELGNTKSATNAKARRMLGWEPRSNEEALFASAESLVKLGIVKV